MTSVQNTYDSSENHQNATASPLRSPKFLRISKERHKSMSITKTPTKSRAEEYVIYTVVFLNCNNFKELLIPRGQKEIVVMRLMKMILYENTSLFILFLHSQ